MVFKNAIKSVFTKEILWYRSAEFSIYPEILNNYFTKGRYYIDNIVWKYFVPIQDHSWTTFYNSSLHIWYHWRSSIESVFASAYYVVSRDDFFIFVTFYVAYAIWKFDWDKQRKLSCSWTILQSRSRTMKYWSRQKQQKNKCYIVEVYVLGNLPLEDRIIFI